MFILYRPVCYDFSWRNSLDIILASTIKIIVWLDASLNVKVIVKYGEKE